MTVIHTHPYTFRPIPVDEREQMLEKVHQWERMLTESRASLVQIDEARANLVDHIQMLEGGLARIHAAMEWHP